MNTNAYDTEMPEGSAPDGVELAPENMQAEGESGQSLEEVLSQQGDTHAVEAATDESAAEPQGKDKTEPGWIKGRIEAGVRREAARIRAEVAAEIRAEYEQQLQPMREAILSRQADDLVASGKITDKALALEYLRMQQGMPAVQPEQPSAPPRNDKGQFAPRQPQQRQQENTAPDDTDTTQHAQMLFAQSKAILAAGGPDVMAAYRDNPEVRQRILNREWDFSDAAKYLRQQGEGNEAPPPIRTANGHGNTRKQIMDMSDDEFDRLNAQLGKGARVDLRK